ncbi:MAG: hypothetical protein QW305_06450 [Candidatus Bathyarchaeia archaeon]
MRLGMILSLYALKVKVFFGAIRASKANIILLAVYIFSFLPGTIGLSFTVTSALSSLRQGGAGAELFVDILSAAASVIVVAAILFSLRGVTVFEYEQNIVFTSPLRPSEFLAASLLVNLTYLLIFAFPLFMLCALIVSLLSLPPPQAAVILISSILFALSAILLKTSLSLVKALYGGVWINALMLISAFILMFPATSIFMPLPIKYSILPYPSSLLARTLIYVILNGIPLIDLLGLVLFFLASLAFFSIMSKRNFFPFTTQVPLVSPFDASARTQAFKMESNIRFFYRMRIPIRLNLESESLLSFLVKKEVARLAREGSLFTITLMYAVISLIFIAGGFRQMDGAGSIPSPLLILLGTYSIIIPVMLASNWRILEAKNLWLPISSGADLRLIARATFYGFVIVSITIPLAIILPVSIALKINIIQALVILISTSLIGCSVNLYFAVKFLRGRRTGSPSFLIGWLSMLITSLLLLPVYILAMLPYIFSPSIALDIAMLLGSSAYSAFITKIFLNLINSNILFIEV